MTRRFYMLLTCLIMAGTCKSFAQVKPYMVVISTGDDVCKGILYKVTNDSIGVKMNESLVYFKPESIRLIKLKELKRGFRYKKYLSYDPYNEKNYEKISNKMVPVRKWGEKDPTMEEELSGRIITSFYNNAINGVFASIGLMNGSLSTIKVNYDASRFKDSVQALSQHSIFFQQQKVNASTLQASNSPQIAKGN